jgi:hypothetical protein
MIDYRNRRRWRGWLGRLNRWVLHPIGLALCWRMDQNTGFHIPGSWKLRRTTPSDKFYQWRK